jgi:pyridoxal phosphate enzyme (YggS family)
MPVNTDNYNRIIKELSDRATLVAVSKTKPAADIKELYDLGQRDFGENYVQEFLEKQPQLPADIRWHYIGHLQSNKVKYIAPFVHLIHGVDSFKLLKEINKQAEKNNRIINCLLQVYIAQEETKFGLDDKELDEIMKQLANEPLEYIKIVGLMGMASFTRDMNKVRAEFQHLKSLFDQYSLQVLSMGMSADYKIAIEEGSTLVRIGSLLFGERT